MVWAVRQLRRRAGGGAGRWRARRRSGCGRRRWRARPRGRTASSSPRQTWTGSSRTASRWDSIVSFTIEWKEEKTCLIFTLSRVKRDNFVRAVQTQRLTSESEIGCYTTQPSSGYEVEFTLSYCSATILLQLQSETPSSVPEWNSEIILGTMLWNVEFLFSIACLLFPNIRKTNTHSTSTYYESRCHTLPSSTAVCSSMIQMTFTTFTLAPGW